MKRALFFQRSCKIQVKVLETPESDPKVLAARKQRRDGEDARLVLFHGLGFVGGSSGDFCLCGVRDHGGPGRLYGRPKLGCYFSKRA